MANDIKVHCAFEEMLPIEELLTKENPDNPNSHPQNQLEKLASLYRRIGIRACIVISKRSGMITKGHGRLGAAKILFEAGELTEFPVDYQEYEDSHEEWTDILADNQIAELAEMNYELAAPHYQAIADYDTGLAEMIGFQQDQTILMEEILTPTPPETEVPVVLTAHEHMTELQKKYGTEIGQIWTIGKHRFVCGDSRLPEVVNACFDGTNPIMMVTDPPYGVDYDPKWRDKDLSKIDNGDGGRANIAVENDDTADFTDAWKLFPGDVAYVWHSSLTTDVVKHSLEQIGMKMRSAIVWNKSHFAISRGQYHWKHEMCWYCVRKDKNPQWAGDRSQCTVWDIEKASANETGHSTEKPLECMLRPIRNHECPTVYDPFVGSATTIVACEMLNRQCFAIEINPGIVAVALDRLERTMNEKPVCSGTI